jgi:hypothetical protein
MSGPAPLVKGGGARVVRQEQAPESSRQHRTNAPDLLNTAGICGLAALAPRLNPGDDPLGEARPDARHDGQILL